MFPVTAFVVKKDKAVEPGHLVWKNGNFGLVVTLADENLILSLEGTTQGQLIEITDEYVLALSEDYHFEIRFGKIENVVKSGKADSLVYTSAGVGLRGRHYSDQVNTFAWKTGQRLLGELCFDVLAWTGHAVSKQDEHLLFTRNYPLV